MVQVSCGFVLLVDKRLPMLNGLCIVVYFVKALVCRGTCSISLMSHTFDSVIENMSQAWLGFMIASPAAFEVVGRSLLYSQCSRVLSLCA